MVRSGLSLEIARSAQSTCKVCHLKIAKGEPRVGIQRDDERFGSTVSWHHHACFNWAAHNVNSTSDIAAVAGYAGLGTNAQQLCVAALLSPTSAPTAPAPAPAPFSSSSKRKEPQTENGEGSHKKAKKEPTPFCVVAQLAEDLPLSLGLSCIEYAKAKKPSPCMACKGAIKNGEPRVGNRAESQFYEGIQTRWMHLTCAIKSRQLKRISQLEGWDRMGYDANFEIRQHTGEMLGETQERELQETMEALESVQDLLCCNNTHDQLIKALQVNGVSAADLLIEKDSITMAVLISDYLAHGTPEDCPICGCAALVFVAGRITCLGYVDGLSKCQYKASSCRRYKFLAPPHWLNAAWFTDLQGGAGVASAKGGKGKKAKSSKNSISPKSALTRGLEVEEEKPKLSNNQTAEELVRKLMTQQLEKDVSTAVLCADSSWTKKKCRQHLAEIFGESLVEAEKDRVNAEIMRLTQEIRAMTAEQVSVFNNKCKAVSQEDVKCCNKREAEAERKPPEAGSTILQVHRGYEQTGKKRYARVLVDADGVTVYNASLTDTQLKTGINRFYIVQLLELDGPFSGYEIFCHWGRIGSQWEEECHSKWRTTFQTYPIADRTQAIATFKDWFLKKTANEWDQRHNFKARPGMYGFLELSSSVSGGNASNFKPEKGEGGSCKKGINMDERVATLVELLFDEDSILHSMQKADINLEEMPLGQLTSERVAKAKKILDSVLKLLTQRPAAGALVGADDVARQLFRIWESKLEAASTEFFRCIPSTNASVLDTDLKVKRRLEVLDMLADIALTQGMSSNSQGLEDLLAELKCTICPLSRKDPIFKAVSESLEHTAEPVVDKGRMCGFPGSNAVDLLEVFELARYGDAESFARHKSIMERRLLWHGTNVACAAAIVSSGLRVMGSGGRVGTGIYLADEAGKSGHYVRTTQDGVGVMFLAEAALGKQFHVCKETPEIHRLCKAPAGFDSVKAVGKSCPDPSGDVVLKLEGNDVMFATGKPVQVKADKESSYSQNEFLVYDPSQVRLRYLVLLRLGHKSASAHPGVKSSFGAGQMSPSSAATSATVPTASSLEAQAAAALIPPGMSEDDMLQAALAASLGLAAPSALASGLASGAAAAGCGSKAKAQDQDPIVLD